MSSNHVLQLQVNNKGKKSVQTSPSKAWMKKHKTQIGWSAVIYSDTGLRGSEYHTGYWVSRSAPARGHQRTRTHTPWTTEADTRQTRANTGTRYGTGHSTDTAKPHQAGTGTQLATRQ